MKYLTKSGLFLLCICIAYALFAFFDTEKVTADNTSFPAVKNDNQATGDLVKTETDRSTGFPVLMFYSNSILYTNDISKEQSGKLMEHFRETSFFTTASQNKVMIGKEPNNYVLFYQLNPKESIAYVQLQAFAVSISTNVFNHQPLVVKVINTEKEVTRIVTSL